MFAFLLHPAIQQVLLETPSITKLESRYPILTEILIECVRRYPKILGCFAQRHDFLHSFHFLSILSFSLTYRGLSGYLPCLFPVFWISKLTAMTSINKRN